MGSRFILSLNSVCKGIKLYLHKVSDIDIAVYNPLWFTMLNSLCIHYPTVLYKRYFSHLNFTIQPFADDTIAYMAIKFTINAQQDLDNLAIWEG